MARKPKHTTIQNLIQYYISLYYISRERNPDHRTNLSKHIESIEKLNRDYHKELTKYYPDWNTEENRPQLRKEIEFLTQVQAKHDKQSRLLKRK